MLSDALAFLTSEVGEALLAQLATQDLSDARTLSLLTHLRKQTTPENAGALLALARLRVKARDKFGTTAERMFFTRSALEQASDPLVRAYRAQSVPLRVIDAGCGIGADALTFARAGAHVLGLDMDAERVALAQLNARALGLEQLTRFTVADVRHPLPESADRIFFDPARRTADGARIHHVEAYQPPLSLIDAWRDTPVMVKLSPAVELAQLSGYGGVVEFIAVGDDLKEAVLHRHPGAPHTPPTLRATTLTPAENDAVTAHHWERTTDALTPPARPLSLPRDWLIELSPALLRAGLVEDAAHAFDAYQLDPTIAYLTADSPLPPGSPWGRTWRVLSWMPFHLKKLRAHLRENDVGRVTVKKRGSPLTPEQLIAQLKLKGGTQSRTLALTRYDGQPVVLVCEDYAG